MSHWIPDEDDLRAIALGAGVLGTGGGGNIHHGWLKARQQLREGRRIRIVSPTDLANGDLA